MIDKIGVSGLNSKFSNSSQSKTSNSSLIVGRVVDIILDENHPKFKDLGEYQSIGTIIYEKISQSNTGTATKVAKPLSPHIKSYPLVGELVTIISSPSSIQDNADFTPTQYYISSVNLWNSPHHNALPNPRHPDRDILNTPNNNSQSTFVEKDNIHPLLPFTGDIIYEGRFGQSIRFGSTSKSQSSHKNPWSNVGNGGDPITIIRNGQSKNINKESWVNITEDVNNDLSIIYLTSSQKIEFNNNLVNRFTSFNSISKPKSLNSFNSPQIIINSDRVVINSKQDSILIGSKKSINLSTDGFTNIKSNNLYVDGRNVLLGSDNAKESLILGDSFLRDFNLLLTTLNALCSVLEFDMMWPGGVPAPNAPVNTAAAALKTQIEDIKQKLSNKRFTSKISKTI